MSKNFTPISPTVIIPISLVNRQLWRSVTSAGKTPPLENYQYAQNSSQESTKPYH